MNIDIDIVFNINKINININIIPIEKWQHPLSISHLGYPRTNECKTTYVLVSRVFLYYTILTISVCPREYESHIIFKKISCVTDFHKWYVSVYVIYYEIYTIQSFTNNNMSGFKN